VPRRIRLDRDPGEPSVLDQWLGPHALPIRVVDGAFGVRAVAIDSVDAPIEIRLQR
jgi:hypothetical protein